MIPSLFADNLCSLLKNQDRLALTLWYDIETGSYYYEDTIIRVKHNYTYDNFPIDKYSVLTDLSKQIGIKYHMDMDNWDSHKIVESFMILANNLTAEYLLQHKKYIFRIHDEKEHNIKIWEIENKKFREFMGIYLSNSAIYSTEPGKHFGLDLNLYTHFTSPIRRMADIYVHLLIKDVDIKMDLDKCNEDVRKTKRLKRDFERYDIICNLKGVTTTDGYVCNYKDGIVTVYFPELDFCDRFHILPYHLRDNNEEFWKQHAKVKILGKLKVTIAKKGSQLIYNF